MCSGEDLTYSNIEAHAREIAAGILAPHVRLKRIHTESPAQLDVLLRRDADPRWSEFCEHLADLIGLPEDRAQLARLYHYSGVGLHIFQMAERIARQTSDAQPVYYHSREIEATCLLATRELAIKPGVLPLVETEDYHFQRFLRGMLYTSPVTEAFLSSLNFKTDQDRYIFFDTCHNLFSLARLHFALLSGDEEYVQRDFEYNPALVQSLMLNLAIVCNPELNTQRFSHEYHQLVYSNFHGLGKIIQSLELSEDAVLEEGGWFGPGDNKNDLTRFSSLLAVLNDRYSLEVLRSRVASTKEDRVVYDTERKIRIMKMLHPARKESSLRLLLVDAGLDMVSKGQIDASVKSGTRVFLRREPYRQQVEYYAQLAAGFLADPENPRYAYLHDLLGPEAALRVQAHLTDFDINLDRLVQGEGMIDANATHYLMAFKSLFDPAALYSLPDYLRATKDGIRYRSQIKEEKDFSVLVHRLVNTDLDRYRVTANLLLYKPGAGVVLSNLRQSDQLSSIERNPCAWFRSQFLHERTFAGIQLLAPIALPPSRSGEYGFSNGDYLDVNAEIIVVLPDIKEHHSFRKLFVRERVGIR